MRKINVFLLCLLVFFQSCTSPGKPEKKVANERKVFSKPFNWNIIIPKGFDHVKGKDWEELQDKGLSALEKSTDYTVINQTKNIFIFRTDEFNYFEALTQPFDTAVDGSYDESNKLIRDLLYQTFMDQAPGTTIDTSVFKETIDGLEFDALRMKLNMPNNVVYTFYEYNRLFGKKELAVNIMFVDEEKGKLMLEAWRNSTFH